ncbi:MAG: YbhB/YbcL family Raf kinase inhibitor-like protein [Asticcacaulis sp.]|nr:YbhB/YbcL family Raf kinase inhibitor-like protein [Asticcacaulis sp.]
MTLQITVEGFDRGRPIPDRYAMAAPDGRDGGNLSPAIRWTGAPDATRSFAVVVVDRDSPADRTNANVADKVIAEEAQRRDFYHWLLIDIPGDATGLEEGQEGVGVKGRNDFGPRAKGANGYDGPKPPTNDERWHRYQVLVYALDVASLRLEEGFVHADLDAAMEGHVLATDEALGSYSLNPRLLVAAV